MHAFLFFALTDVGQVAHPTACLGALVEPVCRGGRPGLPITRVSSGQTVQSGRAGPGPHVYKRKSGMLGFSFHAPSIFISDGACDDDGCPIARAAVARSPTSTCGGGDSSIRSIGGGSQVGGSGSPI
jgi:hypothetical protein